jgi:hypothetical protein
MESNEGNQKKAGTSNVPTKEAAVNRLSKIRPNPDLTLGGVKKVRMLHSNPLSHL